jgi:sulfate transport system permease protein
MLSLSSKRVLPGFGLSLGSSLFYTCLVLLLPLSALVMQLAQMSLAQYWEVISNPQVVAAYKVTLLSAGVASLFNAVFGMLMAWILTRYRFPGRTLLDGLIDLPFALPTAVAGLTLAGLFSTTGWYGQWLAHFDIKVTFTWLGIAVAMAFTSLPFVVRTVQPVLEELGPEYEEAAETLGATRWQSFRRVVIPELAPALLAGTAISFTRSLAEHHRHQFAHHERTGHENGHQHHARPGEHHLDIVRIQPTAQQAIAAVKQQINQPRHHR